MTSGGCPRCGRPIAVARPQCLYCGAALDPAAVPTIDASSSAAPPSLTDRTLVVVDTASVDARTLAHALGGGSIDVASRAGRGWHLHRILPAADAAEEAAQLRAAGVTAQCLPETAVRPALQPSIAEGGRATAETLELRTGAGPARVRAADILVVVSGSIHRELQTEPLARGRLARSLEPAHRFHVHRVGDERPIEIDPTAFTFDEPRFPPTSSWLEIQGWLQGLAAPGRFDDGFRLVPPALGVANPAAPNDISRVLGVPKRAGGRDGAAVLDNLGQFRFYSGWRAAALRGAVRG